MSNIKNPLITKEDGKVVISVTGHRPDKLYGYNLSSLKYQILRKKLDDIIFRAINKYNYLELHSGMALGADTIWSQAIVAAKETYPDRITFIAEIPDYNQPSRWSHKDRQRWQDLIDYADDVKTYNNNDGKSYAYVLNQRNIGMINASDLLIAIYDGSQQGGTYNAVSYARSRNTRIYRIDPNFEI